MFYKTFPIDLLSTPTILIYENANYHLVYKYTGGLEKMCYSPQYFKSKFLGPNRPGNPISWVQEDGRKAATSCKPFPKCSL